MTHGIILTKQLIKSQVGKNSTGSCDTASQLAPNFN